MSKKFFIVTMLLVTLSGCGVDWFPAPATTSSSTTTTPTTVTATAFTFAAKTNVTAGQVQTSDAITVTLSGGTSAAISVTGGQYSINGGTYTAVSGTVQSGNTVTVQHTAASGDLQTVSTILTVADKSATFSSTTAPLVVAAFTIAAKTGVVPGQLQVSDPVTAVLTSGTSAAISVTGTGGQYAIGSAAATSSPGTVKNGDIVRVQHTSAAGEGQTRVTTLTIGDQSAVFSSTTASSTPIVAVTDFSFSPAQVNGFPGTTQTSSTATVALTGGTSAAIGVTGGSYSINGGSFTSTDGTVQDGNTVAVQNVTPDTVGQTVATTLTIGTKSATFSITSTNITVANFAFTPKTGVPIASTQTSDPVTITLVGGNSAPISITGGLYSINGAAYLSANGIVHTGDIVTVRYTVGGAGQKASSTVTIGGSSADFVSTVAN